MKKKNNKITFRFLFEQSNTFRDVARELGYNAYSYDIEGNPSEKIDLFREIERYGFYSTIFDSFDSNDIVFAFFPCTFFEINNLLVFQGTQRQLKDKSLNDKLQLCRTREFNRCCYYDRFARLIQIALQRGFKLIIENPYTDNYLLKWLPIKPALVILDRTIYGDSFKKPTLFYFINCEPHLFVPEYKAIVPQSRVSATPFGLKRSLISKEFAVNFLLGFVLGDDFNENV